MSFNSKTRLFGSLKGGEESEFLKVKSLTVPTPIRVLHPYREIEALEQI